MSSSRRHWLGYTCAACAGLFSRFAFAQSNPAPPAATPADAATRDPAWSMPSRLVRPGLESDEGGLWALMDREETRLRRSPFRMREEGLETYLREVACRLGGEHCADVRAYPIRFAYFNASMAPNGMMQVWSGLLLRMENEAQLASVIGHEIGHYLQRHTLQQMRDVRDRSTLATFFSLFGVVGLIGTLASLAGLYAFSREHEREADRIGVKLLSRSGYDTREAAKVWQNLAEELSATPGAEPEKVSPMFATHPVPAERQDALLRLSETAPGGELREAEYARMLAPIRGLLLEDEIRRQRPYESVILLSRLLKRDAQDAGLLHHRGLAYTARAKEGDRDLARSDWEAAVASSKPMPASHRQLGEWFRQANQPDKARQHWQRYVEMAPSAADVELIKQQLQELPATT
jgi:beta-barrel assembly-enhancing protease